MLTRAVALTIFGEFPPQRERCATALSAFFVVANVRSSAHAEFCAVRSGFSDNAYCATCMAGGCQVPEPGGRIEGGVSFGQYKRITI
jgi:hypothetical protein